MRSVVDVDSMDPSLVSLKRSFGRSSSPSIKHRRAASASPAGRGRHVGLPVVASDRPSLV